PQPYASPMTTAPVLVRAEDGVGYVKLDIPDRRNALGHDVLTELTATFTRLGGDPSVGVLVLEASGSAFSAGHDVREMQERDEDFYRELFGACSALMTVLRQQPQAVIAKVDGVATAAGCQLV